MRTSRNAVAAFVAGLLSVACGVLAFILLSQVFFLGVVLFSILGFALGVRSRGEIIRADDKLEGVRFADWGTFLSVIVAAIVCFLLPSSFRAREANIQSISEHNLKQIIDALYGYAEKHGGRFPPAVLYDKGSRPLHSWRVLILPYLGEAALYEHFRLDEPWDSPHNLTLLPRMPKVYSVPPLRPTDVLADPSSTYYQVFVGRGTAFEGPEGLHFIKDFPESWTETVLVVEAAAAVAWTSPVDLAYAAGRPLPRPGGISSRQSSAWDLKPFEGFMVGLSGGSVCFVTPSISEATLRNAINRHGPRPPGPDW